MMRFQSHPTPLKHSNSLANSIVYCLGVDVTLSNTRNIWHVSVLNSPFCVLQT